MFKVALMLVVFMVPAFAQDAKLNEAMKACEQHREAPVLRVPRQKIWHPGWEKCSDIQDMWDAAHNQQQNADEAAKALIDELTKGK